MSIASEITRLQGAKNTLKTKLNAKNDAQHQIDDETLDEYGDFVDSIPTGGGGGAVEEKDVNFYDYDGTLLHSYSKTDFLALTEMPENPTHTGLVAQGWNWDLADAKTHVTDYDELDIGQVYTTASGLSEFDIELNVITGLTVTLNMNGTKNWGDGTTDTATSHTYANAGKYTISCDGDTMTTSSGSALFGQSNTSWSGSGFNYSVTGVRLTNISKITTYAVQCCYSLKNILLSNNITTIDSNAFSESYFNFIIIPKSVTSINNDINSPSYLFYYNYSLTKILLPNTVLAITNYMFQYNHSLHKIQLPSGLKKISQTCFRECYSLERITFPKAVTSIGSNAFYQCRRLRIYDFTHLTAIPTLSNTNAFTDINKSSKIIVPNDLYEDWIATSNWTTYADYIVKESDYNAS